VCATIGSKDLNTFLIYNIIMMIVNPFAKHWESANFDPEMENMPHHTEKSQNGKIQDVKKRNP